MKWTDISVKPKRRSPPDLHDQQVVRKYLSAPSEKARCADRIRYDPVASSSHEKNQVAPGTIRDISLIDPRSPEAYINSFDSHGKRKGQEVAA